ncbi:homing endonuclease [Escherichia phage T4]|nr:homing endonuclease [Escherichia phage T4]
MYGWIKTAVSSSISESMKEFWKDDNKYMSNARRNAGKPIYQYDLNGNFIRKYRCITDAAEDMS